MPELSSSSWRKTRIGSSATLADAIRSLDGSALQIALVVGPDDVLIGTLTDGDIRRGLLRGLSLASPVDSIIFRDPLVVPPDMTYETALQLMQANKVHQIPIVDSRRRVLGLHVWDELMASSSHRPNAMVIMAGGRGARLAPHTDYCPKPLLPVAGKPMLEHIIERARSEGIQRFMLAVHYLGHMIEDHFGDGSRWQVQIEYLREASPLGTAGALGLIDSRPEGPMIVSNGDVLTGIRYGELVDFHVRHQAAGTMAVCLHEWHHPFGVVKTQGVDIVGFDEKPVTRSHVNAGVYVLDPSVLDLLPRGEPSDMPAVFTLLRERGERTIVYPLHEPWLDVGGVDEFQRARDPQSSVFQV